MSQLSAAAERRPVIGDIRLGERPDRPRATRLSLLDDMTREAAAARDHGDGAHDLGGKVDLEQQGRDRAGGVDRQVPPRLAVDGRLEEPKTELQKLKRSS